MSTPPPDVDLTAVSDAAAAATDEPGQAQLKQALDRIAALEGLQEDAAQREYLDPKLSDYIEDLRKEIKDIKTLRTIYGSFAITLVGTLFITLLCLIYFSDSPLYKMDHYVASTLIVTLITGIILLVLTLAKGVHRPSVDQAKDDPTAQIPHFVAELIKQIRS